MSWCDKLSSTPAVGVRLTPSFSEAGQILEQLKPILNEMYVDERPTFSIEFVDASEVKINTESGFLYQINPVMASVTFNHRIRAQPTSAGIPVMEMLSQPAPYTKLVDQVIANLIRMLTLIAQDKSRGVTRAGIVSLTNVDYPDAPPGIIDLMNKIESPFGGVMEEASGTFNVRIRENSDNFERCIYTFNRPRAGKGLTVVNLDWQRVFGSPQSANRSRLEEMFRLAKQDALAYFELVAEGGLDEC